MTSSPAADAWSAVRDRPWRFLASPWPWRSLLYLVGAVPVGIAAALALFVVVGVGLLTVVIAVGVVILAEVPFLAAVVAAVERRRLGLVLPQGRGTAAPTLRERLRAGRRLPVSWAEVGYAVLLAGVLWVVDGVVVNLAVVVPLTLLLTPLVAPDDDVALFLWTVDPWAQAPLVVGLALLWLVAGLYLVTLLAVGQAALTRLLLDPQPARLAAAVADLRRSRVDLVDAFETERRRIERDLHDGAQQRLVALTMTLGRAEVELEDGPGLDLVQQAHRQAEEALEALRTTVRGIHPRVLADHGLAAAVHEIADRMPVPVRADLRLPGRRPEPVEAAAYFVVSEALTNVVRHADASAAEVAAEVADGVLVVRVGDDGRGGADPATGSGLAGLALRLEALDGRLTVTSPPGGPTEVRMECPIESRAARSA